MHWSWECLKIDGKLQHSHCFHFFSRQRRHAGKIAGSQRLFDAPSMCGIPTFDYFRWKWQAKMTGVWNVAQHTELQDRFDCRPLSWSVFSITSCSLSVLPSGSFHICPPACYITPDFSNWVIDSQWCQLLTTLFSIFSTHHHHWMYIILLTSDIRFKALESQRKGHLFLS